MVKTLFFLILFPFLEITAESDNSASSDIYYNIIQQDTFYFLLSNNSLKLLSNGNSTAFFLWDSIPGHFYNSALMAVNKNYVLLKNNDTISLYQKDLVNGKLNFKNKNKDNLKHTYFFPFNNDFVAIIGSEMDMLGCNDDSIFIKDTNFATYTGQSINYPYFTYFSTIYKYVDGFGYYQVYQFNEYVTASTSHNGYLIYRTLYQSDPRMPPEDMRLKKRRLQEPDFVTYYNSSNLWGSNDPRIGYGLSAATDKYLMAGTLIYTYTPVFVLDRASYTEIIYFSDKYIFKLGNDITYSTSTSSPPIFNTLNYIPLTNIYDHLEKNPVFSLAQNYPNPFNSQTIIGFTLAVKAPVKIVIYNILGKVVREVISGEIGKGTHLINFNSNGLSSGIYFYSLITGGNMITKKMLILK